MTSFDFAQLSTCQLVERSAYFSGGAVGLTIGSGDALPYRNRLNAGKYLVIVKGTGELIDRATRVLRQFEPENIQGYSEPIGI